MNDGRPRVLNSSIEGNERRNEHSTLSRHVPTNQSAGSAPIVVVVVCPLARCCWCPDRLSEALPYVDAAQRIDVSVAIRLANLSRTVTERLTSVRKQRRVDKNKTLMNANKTATRFLWFIPKSSTSTRALKQELRAPVSLRVINER